MNECVESHANPLNIVERLLDVLSALPVAIVAVVTFADVFARYLFSSPLRGSMEIIEYAMALVIFVALPLVTKRRQHVSVSLIDGLVKGNVRRAKMIFCDLISVVALSLLSWRLWSQAVDDLRIGTKTDVLGLWNAPLNFALAVLAGIAAAATLSLMWQTMRNVAVPA